MVQILSQAPLPEPTDMQSYAVIGILILNVIGLAAAMMIVAHVFGPKRHGPIKDSPYESGVPPIVDTQRRFNIRFYIVAMLFMLFDVEVIFMWPWAVAFYKAAAEGATVPLDDGTPVGKGFLLAGMGLFFILLVFGLIYEWKKGAFQWD
jgi:NADH-quinone oxidoreductase subunit A